MKTYTIIGGVNGVGKSSLTGVLKAQRSDLGTIIDVDKITADLGGTLLNGEKVSIKMIRKCIEKGVSFTQETTLSGHMVVETAKELLEKGYYIRLFYVALDTAERDIRQRAKGTKWTDNNGRPSKVKIVEEWQRQHPEGTKADCHRETGLDPKTIRKWWDCPPLSGCKD